MKQHGFSPKARWDRGIPGSDSRTSLLNEKIAVLAFFKSGRLEPRRFSWNNKEYSIEKINYSWQERIGEAIVSYFSVTICGQVYQISFNNTSLGWRMDRVIG